MKLSLIHLSDLKFIRELKTVIITESDRTGSKN